MNGLNGGLPPQDDSNNVEQQDLNINLTTELNDNNLNKVDVIMSSTIKPTSPADNTYEISDKNSDKNLDQNSDKLSSVLIVNNLVRPFTLLGLKKVLGKCGKIIDNKLWLNKDKSMCYVVYENERAAEESREYINSLKWPASNPNTLKATFGNLDELDELFKKDEEEKIQLEKERKEAAALEAAKQEERKQQLKEELSKKFNDTIINDSLNNSDQNRDDSLNNSTTNSKSNKNKTIKEDDNLDREREVSPARNPVSNVLYITNLVRPFTAKQLKELLRKHGPMIEEKFWTDSIRSRCYVVYESNDDALKARNAIHGLKWPITNTKTLRADFGKLGDVNELLNLEKSKGKDEKASNDKLNDSSKEEKLQTADKQPELPLNDKQKENHKSNENWSKQHNKSKNNSINRTISPARHPITNIIYLRNLSRPFTLNQLKELLSQIGNLNEEKFWIDKIKSKCYACYESEEIAIKTREILHNLTWPTGNQRKLVCDFANEAELEKFLNQDRLEKASKEIHEQVLAKEDNRQNKQPSDNRNIDTSFEKGDKTHSKPEEIEEINNQEKNDNQHESSSNKRRRERSFTPIKNKRDYRAERIEASSPKARLKDSNYQVKESPGKLLDDLFKKTKTVPSIYWMPLNEEEIKLRDEKRENRKLEEERRQKEAVERLRRHAINPYNKYNGSRRRTPPPNLERTPPHRLNRCLDRRGGYEPLEPRDRYIPNRTIDRRPPPYRSNRSLDRFSAPRRSDKLDYVDSKRMPDNRYTNDRAHVIRRTPPIRTSPTRHHQERIRRRTPVDNERRNSRSRSASTHSSTRESDSSRSSAGSSSTDSYGKRRRSRSRSHLKERLNKRPISPRSPPPMPRYSRSPKSPRRMDNRKIPPTRR